jgi:hypothetical protein
MVLRERATETKDDPELAGSGGGLRADGKRPARRQEHLQRGESRHLG